MSLKFEINESSLKKSPKGSIKNQEIQEKSK